MTSFVVAASIGCGATRHPPPLPEPPQPADLRRELSTWVVGIREPVVRYSDPVDVGPDVLAEVRAAAHLIDKLRVTGLFGEVNFTAQLRCAPDLELVVRAREDDAARPAPLWLWPLTLSLAIVHDDDGVALSPASEPGATFELPYPTTLVIGVLPLLFSPILITGVVPTWSFMSPGHLDEDLRRLLLSNADRLGAHVDDSAVEVCRPKEPAPNP